MYDDEYYMNIALELAQKAFDNNEIPVGAVIVLNDKIISKAYNQKDNLKLVTKHAEIIAIEKANAIINDWRLCDATLYVTMEPCPMCAGAIQQSRIKRIVYGCSSNINENEEILLKILQSKNYNHYVEVKKGVLEEKSSALMKKFFTAKRSND